MAASRTRNIKLLEHVKRTTSSDLARGTRLFRISEDGTPAAAVNELLQFEFTVFNTTDRDLQDCEILFEFASPDTSGWAERPKRSNTQVQQVPAEPTAPWKTAIRWRIPQFPPGDSLELSFQSIEPTSDKYAVALYNAPNVVVETTREQPAAGASNTVNIGALGVLAVFVFLFSMGIWEIGAWAGRRIESAPRVPPPADRSGSEIGAGDPGRMTENAIRVLLQSWQKAKFEAVCGSGLEAVNLGLFWADEYIPNARQALTEIRKLLDSNGLACSSTARLTKNEVQALEITGDYDRAIIAAEWMADLRVQVLSAII